MFLGVQKDFLPLAGAATEDLLPFVAKIFEILESIAFYVGLIITVGFTMKGLLKPSKVKKLSPKEEADESDEVQ
jgi:hypothetical protein